MLGADHALAARQPDIAKHTAANALNLHPTLRYPRAVIGPLALDLMMPTPRTRQMPRLGTTGLLAGQLEIRINLNAGGVKLVQAVKLIRL